MTTTLQATSNPILTKLRSIPAQHRVLWVRGFLDQVDHVYFANWSVADADAAKVILVRWMKVYGD